MITFSILNCVVLNPFNPSTKSQFTRISLYNSSRVEYMTQFDHPGPLEAKSGLCMPGRRCIFTARLSQSTGIG